MPFQGGCLKIAIQAPEINFARHPGKTSDDLVIRVEVFLRGGRILSGQETKALSRIDGWGDRHKPRRWPAVAGDNDFVIKAAFHPLHEARQVRLRFHHIDDKHIGAPSRNWSKVREQNQFCNEVA